jgi:hypothetical protein
MAEFQRQAQETHTAAAQQLLLPARRLPHNQPEVPKVSQSKRRHQHCPATPLPLSTVF